MVGIVTGQGAGLERSSASVLGSRGQIGSSAMGRGGDQVFINAATGSLVINRRDEFLVGRGPDTAYGQTYDSSGMPQYAWMQGVHRVLTNLTGTVNTAGSTISRGDADGHYSVYTYDSAKGAYVSTEGGGAYDELRNVGGAWTWTDGDSRMTETYTTLSGVPGYHFVATLSDADGNTQSYTWYSNGTIQRITNANGEYAEFTQINGLPTQVTTYTAGGVAALTRVRYAWDAQRRLSSVSVDLSPNDHSVADGNVYTTNYTYDGSSARITSITQTDGSKLEIAYTQTGNEYRATKLTQTVSAGVTRVTGLHYDLSARTTTIIDALGAATTLKYDAAGNLTQVAHPIPAPGASRPTTVFAYNSSGDVISVTEDGRTTTYTYDSRGNVTLKRDAAGNTVSRTYGSKNELLTATEYLVADPDGGGSQQAASPVTTRYAYDSKNHLRFEVSSEGRVTEYRYDATTGVLVSTLRYTANSYSLANLTPTSTISEAALVNWAAGISDKSTVERTDATYDLRGNVQSVTTYSKTFSDGSGDSGSTFTRTFYVYDQAGNLLSRQVGGQTGVETFAYDGLNRITSSTDATGAVVTFTFLDSTTTTRIALAGGSTQVSVFNQAGERISLTESASDITARTSYRYYDALGRLRKDTDAAGNSTYFLYDSIGRKAAEITADGAVTEYGYDSGNRLVKTVSYANRLTDAQINQLSAFSAGGAGGASAGGVSAPTGASRVANGSFEQSGSFTDTATGRSNVTLPGWTKANPETFEQVNSGAMGVYASDGNYWLDLESIIQSGVVPVGSTLLVNGSFEQTGTYVDTGTGRSSTTMPGWTKANAETFEVVSSGQLGVTATNGGFWLDLDSIPSPGRQAIGSNLLINGSFETSGSYIQIGTGRANSSLPGWTKANPQSFEQVDADGSEIIGYDGAWYLDMDSVPSAAGMVPGVNLIVNGSFEESATSYTETAAGRDNAANLNIPGWVKTNAQGFQQLESGANGVAASDGDYYLDMEANAGPESRMDISQTIGGLVAGKQLTLKFDYANIAGLVADGDGGFDNNAALEVYWNGFLLGRVTALDAAMTTKGFTVTSIAGNNVLRFKEIGVAIGDARGSYLDNVQLYEMVAAPNLIVNGGFEQSATTWAANSTNTGRMNDAAQNIPGWVKANSQGFEQLNSGTGGVTATEGNFFLDMESGGGFDSRMDISQTISNMVGSQPLTLKFDFANKAGMVWDVEDYENSGSLEVWWNGIKIAVLGTQDQSLKTKTYSVMSRAGDNVLRFREIGVTDGKGVWLDNVRLHANSGGNMDISQTVTGRTAGEIMQLQFDHASLPNVEDNTFAVYWNGTHVATIDDADINEQMRTKTFFLTAQAGNNTVRFVGLGAIDGVGAALDNVRLHATQLPPNGGNMDISQTVSLSAGKVMLQFDHANRTPGESGGFQVWWNGQLIDTIVETGASMRPKSYVLDAIAGNNVVRFKGTGTVDAAGASLDNVRLFATQPAPSGGNMDISQTVTGLASGEVLQLQFDHANRTGGPSGFFEVYWNNALVAVINETGPAMQNKKYNVTAAAGDNILRFRSLGTVDAAGASLDNVRLFALQSGSPDGAPATDPLFGLRPIAAASDQWAWRVYDSADRVVQTIDGAGGAETFVYDGASRLVSSRAYAIPFSASAIAGFKATPPTSVVAPSANTGTDRTARRFYDNEGRLVGTLDGAGGLTQIFHDARGRKIREIAYANAAASSLWASASFADLLGNVGTSGSDRRVDYVYDRQGMVRFTIDALGQPTEFVYDSAGLVIRTVEYAGTIGTGSNNTVASVQTAIAAANLASHPANRVSRTVYDGAGRVAFTIDAEGGTTAYAYDQIGNVTKETRYNGVFTATEDQTLLQMQNWAGARAGDSANRVTRRIFDASGRQAYAVDAEGYVTEQRYDAVGRVTRSICYAASYAVSDTATKTTLANLIGTPAGAVEKILAYDSAGRLTDVTDGSGNTTHYVYDGIGRVTEETAGWNTGDASTVKRVYNAAGRVTSETRAHGTAEASTTTYFYDAVGNLLTITDARGFATTRSYDALGHLTGTNITIDPVTSISTSYAYNRFGEEVRATDARGYSTFSYYDRRGRLVAQRDAEDFVSETGYNVFGDRTSVTRRANKATNPASADSYPVFAASTTADATTSFLYDRNGRLTRTTDAENHYEQYTLNAFGDRVTVRNKLGGLITNVYDKRGLLVTETLPMASVDAEGTTVSSTVTNRFEYDSRGNRTKRYEAWGLSEQRSTTFVYDKADRLTETRGDWVIASVASGAGSWVQPTERIAYDRRGNIIESVDALGARTLYYYDRQNRVTAEIGALGTLTTHSYDANGNLLKTRVYGTTIPQPGTAGGTAPTAPGGEFRETSHLYDGLNRMLTRTVASVRTGAWSGSAYQTSVGNVTTSYEYDSSGNNIKTTDGNGGVSYSLYDKLNRVTGKIDAEGYPTIFEYDAEGNVTKERRYVNRAYNIGTPQVGVQWLPEDRETVFTYDRNGRRLTEVRNSVLVASLDSNGVLSTTTANVQITYTYNGLGQVTSKTEATGDSVVYGYDVSGRLTSEKRASFADHVNSSVRPTVRYYYDGLNNLKRTRQGKESLGSGDRVTRYYHGAGGRLSQMINAAGESYYYAHDAAGNVVLETYDRLKSDGSYVSEGLTYSRDVLGRVTVQAMAQWNGSSWARGDTQETSYNAYGEMSQRGINNLGQEQFAYDGAGRLWRTNSGDGVWRYFVYDANGNQTLAIESEGANLANLSMASVLSIAGGGGSVGSTYVDGVNTTIIAYDKRGQAVQTRLSKRQLSEAGTAVDLVAYRSYNSFGELASETDARGYVSYFTYNTMGRLTRKVSPWVLSTGEDGVASWVQPTELFHYDVSGRMIGVTDANGNETARKLLAGTGYGEAEALVTAEYHEDGGVFRTYYDVYGDARILRNELGQDESRAYDAMGRLVTQTHRGGLVDSYAYDLLGQRIQHWNNVIADPVYEDNWVWVQDPYTGEGYWENQPIIVGWVPIKELTDYDLQGRVVSQVAFGGDTTTTYYYWQGFETVGLGTYGGWTQVTTYANFRNSAVDTDIFGHDVYRRDLGGHEDYFTYDLAGRLTQKSGAETFNYTYLNTGLVATASRGFGSYGSTYELTKSFYSYDSVGNKLTEKTTYESGKWNDPFGQPWYSTTNTTYQNASATYDGLSRMTSWVETGNATTPASRIDYEYDANGNVRRTKAQYRTLDNFGNASGFVSVQDNYYLYDAMNRVTLAKGIRDTNMTGTVKIRRGTTGANYAYDQAGRRVSTTRSNPATAQVWDPDAVWWDEWGNQHWGNWVDAYYEQETREDYGYDSSGQLSSVRVAIGGYTEDGNGGVTPTPAPSSGSLRASHTRDLMGRLTRQIDYLPSGVVAFDRTVFYNNKGQVTSETVINRQGTDTLKNVVTNEYGTGSGYALGAVVSSTSANYKNNVSQGTSTTTTTFAWYDGAVQSSVTHKPNSSTTYTTSYAYSGSGHLTSSTVTDGRPRTITFLNDTNGQTIRRDEADGNHSTTTGGDPHEVWYRFNGRQLGYTGNNGTLDTDYERSVSNRTVVPGSNAFRFGSSYGSAYADFDQGVDTITSYSQGGAGGSYTVRSGDTLGGIAAQLWGDSSLWYKLAEANGMSAGTALSEGQQLIIPSGVMKSRHNASTFKPYDPGEIIGDTSPTTPKPQKRGNKCGTFGMILLVVIAVAVTALTWGAATTAFGPIFGGAVAGAAGSVASQAVGVATGIQEEFSWKGVALAAIGGAVGGAIAPAFNVGNSFVNGALRGAVSSAVTQGIAVATGLQDKFDWAGVAAAAIGGGIGEWSSTKVGGMNKYAGQATAGTASAIANAATRSLINGSDFGDNLLAALPDVIGSTVGTMVSDAVTRSIRNAQVATILDIAGLDAAEGDNQISKEWVNNFLDAGGTLTEAVEFFTDPDINQAARYFDASRAGGITQEDSNTRFARTLEAYETARATAATTAPAGGEDQMVADVLSQTIDVYAIGPNGSDIGKNVVSGGVKLLEGVTSFYDKHPRIASIGFTATQSVLTGGPLKTIATKLAGDVFSEALDVASGFAVDKSTPFLTDLATSLDWKIDLSIGSRQASIGPRQLGAGGGQLTGSVVSTLLGGGIVWVVKRGRLVQQINDPKIWEVGPYNLLEGKVKGLDAHHVGQKAAYKKMIANYDEDTAPSILVPKEGHTFKGIRGIVSRSLKGLDNPRDVLARDIRELQRVYPDIPHAKLRELVRMNKSMYADAFKRKPKP